MLLELSPDLVCSAWWNGEHRINLLVSDYALIIIRGSNFLLPTSSVCSIDKLVLNLTES